MLKSPTSTYNFSIKSYEADQLGRMSLHNFFHYLQECAYLNALSNGFGYEFLEKENAYWVLTRVLVQIDEFPNWNDKIQIKTWPRGAEGLFAVRDFELLKNNKVIGRISSYWMILDKDTRRPKRLDDYEFLRSDFVVEQAIAQKLEKIRVKGELEILDHRKVYPSDMDVNGHVNNATYVRWILDSAYSKTKGTVKEFEINFIRELMLNDEFDVCKTKETSQSKYVIKNIKGQEVCLVQIKM